MSSTVPPEAGDPEVRSLGAMLNGIVPRLSLGPALKGVLLGTLVFPVGLATLWAQFRALYNTDFITAWYASSLVPPTIVAVHGVLALWAPLLCIIGGAVAVAAPLLGRDAVARGISDRLDRLPRSYLSRRWRRRLQWLAAVLVTWGALLAIALLLLFAVEWPLGAGLCVPLLFGAAAAGTIVYRRKSRFPRRPTRYLTALGLAYAGAVALVCLDLLAVGVIFDQPIFVVPEQRPLPFAEVVLNEAPEAGAHVIVPDATERLSCYQALPPAESSPGMAAPPLPPDGRPPPLPPPGEGGLPPPLPVATPITASVAPVTSTAGTDPFSPAQRALDATETPTDPFSPEQRDLDAAQDADSPTPTPPLQQAPPIESILEGGRNPQCTGGSLLSHQDGYWYFFADLGENEPYRGKGYTLRAIPEGEILDVTVFPARRTPADSCHLRVRATFPFLYISPGGDSCPGG